MKEIYRSNDIVTMTYLQSALREAGIDSVIFDQHASIVEGSISALQKRLMVIDEDAAEAQTIVKEKLAEHE